MSEKVVFEKDKEGFYVFFPSSTRHHVQELFKSLKQIGYEFTQLKENAISSYFEHSLVDKANRLLSMKKRIKAQKKINATFADKQKEIDEVSEQLKIADHELALARNQLLNDVGKFINLSAIKKARKMMFSRDRRLFDEGQTIIVEQLDRLNRVGLTSQGLKVLRNANFKRAIEGDRDDPRRVTDEHILKIKALKENKLLLSD